MNNTVQKLVEQYVPLANKLAYQKKKTLPNFIDVEELKSAAYLGLSEAASRYNPDLGVAFSTYAYPRIFGAIYDYLRELGWGKRGELKQMVSLNSLCDDSNQSIDVVENHIEINENESKDFFNTITLDLEEQANEVLQLYFIDESSMKEVGERFGVSESRISQLIKRYKDQISNKWTESELKDLAA